MKADEVERGLGSFEYAPLTSPAVGRLLYEFALSPVAVDILELGTAHGTSTAYLAAALDEKGGGRVTTIDRPKVLERTPNVHDVLGALGLAPWVSAIQAPSYNRALMQLLEAQTVDGATEPCFDLAFIDGAHTWETDALAFLLVDRLLRPGRWLVLDDIAWSLGGSPALRDTERVRELGEEERDEEQMRKVVDLLIRTNPDYQVRLLGNVAIAFKGSADDPEFQRLAGAARAFAHEFLVSSG